MLPGIVELEISHRNDLLRWEGVVGFADFGAHESAAAILGHAKFLEYFTATFDGHQKQLTLRPTTGFPEKLSIA